MTRLQLNERERQQPGDDEVNEFKQCAMPDEEQFTDTTVEGYRRRIRQEFFSKERFFAGHHTTLVQNLPEGILLVKGHTPHRVSLFETSRAYATALLRTAQSHTVIVDAEFDGGSSR